MSRHTVEGTFFTFSLDIFRLIILLRYISVHLYFLFTLQAVVLCSKKRFQFTEQGDAVEFMSWFLNALDMALKPKKLSQQKSDLKLGTNTIVSRSLRGCMRVYSRKILPVNLTAEEKLALVDSPEYMASFLSLTLFSKLRRCRLGSNKRS